MPRNNQINVQLRIQDEASRVLDAFVAKAGLTAGAFVGISRVIEGINSQLQGAIALSDQLTVSAGDFMKIAGVNFATATQFLDGFAVRMSQVAADLPGATADYVRMGNIINDSLIPAFQDLNGVLNPTEFKAALEQITTDATVRAVNTQIDINTASLAVTKFMAGTLDRRLAFFERNPAVFNTLKDAVKESGKALKDLSAQQKVEILREALKVPDEVIKASRMSISGMVEGFRSSLFDPTIGVFGLLRDLDPTAGKSTVLLTLRQAVESLVGENGLIPTLGNTLALLGVELTDPMVSLQSGIRWFADKVQWLSNQFQNFNSFLASGQRNLATFGETIEHLTDKTISDISGFITRGFNSAIAFLNNVDLNAVGAFMGNLTAEIANGILNVVLGIDWGGVLKLLGKLLMMGLSSIGSFLVNLDWKVYLIGALVAFTPLVGSAILGTLASLLPIGITAVAGTLLTGLLAGLAGLPLLLIAGVSLAFIGLVQVIRQNWDRITSLASSAFDSLKNIFEWLKENAGKVVGFISNPVGAIASTAASVVWGNRADGNFPEALQREVQAMPIGSKPVVANSSELILNRSQQKGLLQSNPSLSIGEIKVYSNATDAKQVALEVMDQIKNQMELARINRLYA